MITDRQTGTPDVALHPQLDSYQGDNARHLRAEDLLPPPPMGRCLAAAGVAAIIGAAAWAALLIFANIEHGVIAWGIGGLVGFAIVKSGGHGMILSVCGAMLAVLAIGAGKHFSYKASVAGSIEASMANYDATSHGVAAEDADLWHALGDSPTDDQITDFAIEREFTADNASDFRKYSEPMLEWFHANKPTLQEWRAHEQPAVEDWVAENYTFIDYLKGDFHLFDILFVILGLATAFGLVSRHTAELQESAREHLQAERQTKEAPGHQALDQF